MGRDGSVGFLRFRRRRHRTSVARPMRATTPQAAMPAKAAVDNFVEPEEGCELALPLGVEAEVEDAPADVTEGEPELRHDESAVEPET